MCVKPNFIWLERGPIYEQQQVNCRNCWQCLSNRVNDYVGRSLCEAHSSDWVCALTLTYAPRNDLADKVLTPPHFQQFIRSLRDAHHKIRYLAAGEYGELKGRAHFHVILFGKGPRPAVSGATWPNQKNFHTDHWPHGHVYADWNNDEAALRYVCKYLLKSQAGQSWFSLSKKPSLGYEFFQTKASNAIRLGCFPASFEYQPPGGSKRTYLLTGATRRDYLLKIVDGLDLTDKAMALITSEWVGDAIDKAIKNRKVHNGVDLTFPQLVEDMKEQQALADTVFSYEWQKRFDKKQKLLQSYAQSKG